MVLETIKRLLGMGDSTGRRDRTETEVTVEREPEPEPEPETESEAAVKGTDASASTGSLVDEEAASAEPAARAEPAEAAGPESADETTDVESVEPEAEPESEAEPASATGGSTADVTEIKGIGPAYGDRLGEAGIETVGDLAAADAAEVAEQVAVGENRVQRWIDRAAEFE